MNDKQKQFYKDFNELLRKYKVAMVYADDDGPMWIEFVEDGKSTLIEVDAYTFSDGLRIYTNDGVLCTGKR